jgi:hypothetical protein
METELSYIAQLQSQTSLLADHLLKMEEVMVGDTSLHSHALRIKGCNHLKEYVDDVLRLPAHCKSSICGNCGRWRYEQVADRARWSATQLLQPRTEFKDLCLTVRDVPTDAIRDTVKILRNGCGKLIEPVKGMLGSLWSLEVAKGENPQEENVHLHGLIALDTGRHSGRDRYSRKDWTESWFDNVENARSAHIKTLKDAEGVNSFIDYIAPTNHIKKGFLARIAEALRDPARYVGRAQQLFKLPRHWPTGEFITPEMPVDDGSGLWTGLTKEKWVNDYSKMVRSFGPVTRHPHEDIPIDGAVG